MQQGEAPQVSGPTDTVKVWQHKLLFPREGPKQHVQAGPTAHRGLGPQSALAVHPGSWRY